MVVAELARRCGASWKPRRLVKADTAEVQFARERVVLATTRAFMNVSGTPVRNLLADLRLQPDHLVVVHDELDLALGQIRVKFGGGDNGHNGLKSIRAMIGTRDYFRVRAGIGRPADRTDVTDWVLTGFAPHDRAALDATLPRAGDAVESLVTAGLEVTQATFNS
jgi:PTH1 family peptidyl-tRNA hydrolase